MLYYTKTVRETLNALDSTEKGLTTREAHDRIELYGLNRLQITGESVWKRAVEPFASVFMLVLFVASCVSILNQAYIDAMAIFTIIFISATTYYIQRSLTERVMRSFIGHRSLKIATLRNSKRVMLDATALVPGDIISLSEGNQIPVDARLIKTQSLSVDESQLTGQSAPTNKEMATLTYAKEIHEQKNMLFQGTFIIAGEALAVVVATGNHTVFSKQTLLSKNPQIISSIQGKIDRLVLQVTSIIIGVAFITFALALLRGMNISDSLQFVIALSVSAIPESLPIAITIVLIFGMRRMIVRKALIRAIQSIETIGNITTIATDRTGVLTHNKVTVQTTWQLEYNKNDLIRVIALAINNPSHKSHDPLDTALREFVDTHHANRHPSQPPLTAIPFTNKTPMSGNIWHNGDRYDLVLKGMPEAILSRSDLTDNEVEKAHLALHALAAHGHQVIAIAHRTLSHPIDRLAQLSNRERLSFDGFVAVTTTLRPEAKKAIQTALRAGINVRIITGDHLETAYAIGQQLDIVHSREQVLDSYHMNLVSDDKLKEVIKDIRIFSRAIPEHKYRILKLLKEDGVIAMTGHGAHDTPALVSAHVGVTMGSDTSVAKETGDIILIDDNFKSIVDAIHEGRVIFANIRRMAFYLLSTNAGEVLTMIGALLIGVPVPLIPLQILWVNLITDSFMIIPLGLEPGEKQVFTHKPNTPNTPLFGKFLISRMILIAISMATLTLVLYLLYSSAYGYGYGQTIAFSALVTMQWANALCARSDSESLFVRISTINYKLSLSLAFAVILQLLVLFGPLGDFLHISHVTTSDFLTANAIAFLVPIILVEMHKLIGRRIYKRAS